MLSKDLISFTEWIARKPVFDAWWAYINYNLLCHTYTKERFQSSTTSGITFNTFIATIEGLYEQGIWSRTCYLAKKRILIQAVKAVHFYFW